MFYSKIRAKECVITKKEKKKKKKKKKPLVSSVQLPHNLIYTLAKRFLSLSLS